MNRVSDKREQTAALLRPPPLIALCVLLIWLGLDKLLYPIGAPAPSVLLSARGDRGAAGGRRRAPAMPELSLRSCQWSFSLSRLSRGGDAFLAV